MKLLLRVALLFFLSFFFYRATVVDDVKVQRAWRSS
ncbi:hypothetical protein GGD38_004799 [Chitinophagaceae bacterium OAS944]|nr:hypothetical protein [Chitinophagaceae bacterium OAS944]